MALLIKNGAPDVVVDSIITEGDVEEEGAVVLDVDVDTGVEDVPTMAAAVITTSHRKSSINSRLNNEQ